MVFVGLKDILLCRRCTPIFKYSLSRLKSVIFGKLIIVYVLLVIFALFNFKSRVKTSYPYYLFETNHTSLCWLNSSELGPVKLDMFYHPSVKEVMASNKDVNKGGHWQPLNCRPWQRVAIIIPYRDRHSHLIQLLARLHPMLQKQKIYYTVFVIEQDAHSKFNRGRLLNVGVVESLKHDDFDCFVFHDVDLLPEDDRNIYYCDHQVHHLISAIDEMRYHLLYYNYLGGAISISKENVFMVNGHSNDYWGWGNEDDDFNARTNEAGLLITRPPQHLGRYKMARHEKLWNENRGNELFMTWRSRWLKDGLNQMNASKYKVVEVTKHPLYTNISIEVGSSPVVVTPDPTSPKESLFWFLGYYFP